MKIIDITFDLETTSLSADAAILQIGAVAWDSTSHGKSPFFDFGDNDVKELHDAMEDRCMYLRNFSLAEQYLAGCDIDKDTQRWWSQQDKVVRAYLFNDYLHNVAESLHEFFDFMRKVRNQTDADAFNLWCQGPDTDIAILKMAAKRFLNIKPHDFPVKHTRFRDCRTVILTYGVQYMMDHAVKMNTEDDDFGLAALNAKQNKLYDEYTKDPNVVYNYLPLLPEAITNNIDVFSTAKAHNALYDAVLSSWNTWCVLQNYDAPEKSPENNK